MFSCKLGALPLSYLRFPVAAFFKLVAVWNVMEERFYRKLAKDDLSKGERTTLMWSILSGFPIYIYVFILYFKNDEDDVRRLEGFFFGVEEP